MNETFANGSILNETYDGASGVDTDEGDGWVADDATWILCSSFIIFTMQTGKKLRRPTWEKKSKL